MIRDDKIKNKNSLNNGLIATVLENSLDQNHKSGLILLWVFQAHY